MVLFMDLRTKSLILSFGAGFGAAVGDIAFLRFLCVSASIGITCDDFTGSPGPSMNCANVFIFYFYLDHAFSIVKLARENTSRLISLYMPYSFAITKPSATMRS